MIRIFLTLLVISIVQSNERRFSPFRSAFRISGQSSLLARSNEDDLNESHITLLPSATRSKPLQTTPFNMATTKKKIISTLLEMTENEISKKISQLDSAENNEVLSSNNKRFIKSEPSTTVASERSPDSATSSLFELSTEASAKQTSQAPSSTTAKPRKQIKITTSSSSDSIAAAEAAAAAIASMHSMAFKPIASVNRVSINTATSKIPIHHHNPYNDYGHDKINFDVNYRPATEPPTPQSASSSPSKKSKDKNRESVKNLVNGLVNFVSSPLFSQAKPIIVSSFSTVSNALSANKNAGGSLSSSGSSSSSSSLSSSSAASSSSALNSGVISKMFNSLRFAVLRRNEATANANKNSKKKGKLNSAVNNPSNNNQSNQSIMMNFLDSLIKTREAFLSMAAVPNKSKPINKLSTGSSTSNKNKNTSIKPYSPNMILNLFRLLYKQSGGLKQEARSI